MRYKGSDFETVIGQESGVTKDLLKSSLFSLKEGEVAVPVKAPTNGKILKWWKRNGDTVVYNEIICAFEAETGFVDKHAFRMLGLTDMSGFMWLHSPAPNPDNLDEEGTLIIMVKRGEVFAGTTIAVVLPKSHFIKHEPATPAE